MIRREPWFSRRFSFDLPVSAVPGLLERLRGTPARVEGRVAGVPAAVLTRRWQDHWSIQENVGHLLDLEPLWLARIDDFAAGRLTLQEADLLNRKTDEANHNARDLGVLVRGFRDARAELVRQLEQADEADWLRTARHPRLHAEMRLLDHAFFVAEHDDHHLATITEHLRRSD